MKARLAFFWLLAANVVASQTPSEERMGDKMPLPIGRAEETEDLTIWHLDEKFILLDMTLTSQYASVFGLAACLAIAITAKCSIFNTIFTIGIKSRPINLMIFLDQLCNTLHRSLSILICIWIVVTGRSVSSILGDSACWIYMFLGVFGIHHGTFGNFGITLFRIVSIKCNITPRQGFWWSFAIALSVINMLLSPLVGYIWTRSHKSTRSFYLELCYAHDTSYRTILADYQGLESNLLAINAVLAWAVALHILEFCMYVIIIHHIYMHDKGMTNILTRQAIRNRHKRSAISLACEMYLFVIETTILITLWLTHKTGGNTRNYIGLWWLCEFAFKSTVQALSGMESRDWLVKLFRGFKLVPPLIKFIASLVMPYRPPRRPSV